MDAACSLEIQTDAIKRDSPKYLRTMYQPDRNTNGGLCSTLTQN